MKHCRSVELGQFLFLEFSFFAKQSLNIWSIKLGHIAKYQVLSPAKDC